MIKGLKGEMRDILKKSMRTQTHVKENKQNHSRPGNGNRINKKSQNDRNMEMKYLETGTENL